MTLTQTASGPGDVVVSVERLTIAHERGQVLLADTDITLRAGEVVILAGPSGSGKSTLVNLLSGAIEASSEGWRVSGTVRFGGHDYDVARHQVSIGGVVFQDFALFDELTVSENLTIAADHAEPVDDRLRRAIDGLLSDVDLNARITECSGGQRQRVAIARTLLGNHPVLFLDEPNSGLDVGASRRLSRLVSDLGREVGVPVVIIAHHFRHLIDVADRVLLLDPARFNLREVEPDQKRVERTLEEIDETRAAAAAGPGPDFRMPEAPDTQERFHLGPVRSSWMLRFLVGYIWEYCFAPSALLFVALGSVIIGFVTTWFIFQYLPFRDLLMPIIHSDALAGLAFSELRVLAPLVTAVLITTRNAALIGADLGHKVYSHQIKAMRNLNVSHKVYIIANVLIASTVAALVLTTISVCLTAWTAMMTWSIVFPENSTYLWRDQFFQRLWPPGVPIMVGVDWVIAKAVPSIVGGAGIALYFGYRPKGSVIDINQSIARALIWGMSFVLTWQSILTLIEFKHVSARLETTF